MNNPDIELFHNYSIPKNTSELARSVLTEAHANHFSVLVHTSDPASMAKNEIIQIAFENGLELFSEKPNELILIDRKFYAQENMPLLPGRTQTYERPLTHFLETMDEV